MPSWNLMPRLNVDFTSSDLINALNNLNNENLKDLVKIQLSKIYGVNKNNIFFISTGRAALYLILKSLNLKKGAKIGIQLFCCPVVFEAIVRAGYKPIFLEIEPNTFTLDQRKLKFVEKELDALITIHTFGNPVDMDSIKRIMGKKPIIEDCAHANYSKYKNKLVGTIGDASFFSYGPGKDISAGGGGIFFINNQSKFEKSIKLMMKNLHKPTFKENVKFIFFNYSKSLFYKKPWFGMFAFEVATRFDEQLDFQNQVNFEIKRIKNPNLAVLNKRFNDLKKKIELQRENIRILEKTIKNLNVKTITQTPNSKPLFYLYPLIFPSSKKRDEMCEKFRINGIDTLKFYSRTPGIAREKYGYRGECVLTEDIISTLLVLPTYYKLKLNLT